MVNAMLFTVITVANHALGTVYVLPPPSRIWSCRDQPWNCWQSLPNPVKLLHLLKPRVEVILGNIEGRRI